MLGRLVLDEAGGTWFFGHAVARRRRRRDGTRAPEPRGRAAPSQEYGQHGDLGGARGDYVDAEYYCVPRLTAPRGLAAAASGSAHVVAVDGAGRLVTWGWPAFGVLGRGRAGPFLSPGPDVVPDVADVLAVAAGGKHCACVVRDAGSAYAPGFYGPLLDAASGDVRVGVGGAFFRCHRVVLANRSSYFRGMLAAAGGEDLEFPAALEGGARVTAPLLRSALEYLYTDRRRSGVPRYRPPGPRRHRRAS